MIYKTWATDLYTYRITVERVTTKARYIFTKEKKRNTLPRVYLVIKKYVKDKARNHEMRCE